MEYATQSTNCTEWRVRHKGKLHLLRWFGPRHKTLVTSKFWIYQHNDRNQFLRFKHWGANNDTEEENYSQVMLPNAWTGGNGLLRYDIYSRLDAFELREQNSTATEVKIITPIFTTGGTKELSISAATTAKAGVMTAADKELLNKIKAKLGL